MNSLTPSLIELASWILATEVMRRAPKLLRIIETHPGGGQYDCLSMVRIVPHLHLCAFNRLGSFTAFGAFDSNPFGTDRWTQINVWERIARGESTRNVLDDICALLHLQVPSPLPATTPASLSPVRWCCLNGFLDSSGFEGYEIRRGLFAPFPAVKAPSNSESQSARFAAFGAQRDQIGGDRPKQSVEELDLFTRLAVSGIDGIGEMVEAVQR